MEILYSDKNIAVCVKPVGADSEQDMPRMLSEALGGQWHVLHRLDQNVGGVMVYARTKEAAAQLSRAIQEGSLVKEYVAMVHGTPPESGELTDLLWKDSRKNKVFVVTRRRAGVKEAKLFYRVLSPGSESLVRIRLYTGRSHQIRVQFSSRGYPLVGERKYSTLDDPCEIALFSQSIGFHHPRSHEWMEFRHDPPEGFPWNLF